MTADDARRLTQSAAEVDQEKVKLVLSLWHEAIHNACREGRKSVLESELKVLRTPIPNSACVAARVQLRNNGFSVRYAENGLKSTVEVSW